MSGPIRQPLADVAPVTPTLNDKAVTIQNNTVRTSSYTAIYNLFKTGFDAAYLLLTGGTMTGNIDMNNNQIKGLGEPTENTDAATKLYVDSQIGGASTLNDVLTNGNTSELDASIGKLGLYDPSAGGYGYFELNTESFDLTSSSGSLIKLNASFMTGTKTLTFPNKNGTFAMLSDLTTKQDKFDYSVSATGAVFVVIDDAMGGVAEFTQAINPRKTQYLTIQSNVIEATSKIICTLVYDGAGFPLIANQKLSANRIDILVTNGDLQANGGATTDASIFIQYQIVG